MTSSTQSPKPPDQFPEGVGWLFIFQSFNAVNFTIAMGSPMILLIRFLGGSELHVGIVVAIPALMVVLQLVSSGLVERLGYRSSMMIGWGLRSLLLLFIAPLPLLVGRYSPEVLLGVLIAAQLGFNIIRGLTSGAWFPWLSQLIPDSIRGKYIGIEQRIINFSAFSTLLLSGLILSGENPAPWKYSAIVIFSIIVGVTSAYFLKRSPDRAVPVVAKQPKTNRMAHLWAVIVESWKSPAYRRTLRYFVLVNLAIFPVQGFLILYIKENLGYTTGQTLKFQALNTLGVMLSSVVWGTLCDRYGSKPVLKIVVSGILLLYSVWLGFAVGAVPPVWWLILILQLLWGVVMSGHVIATVKMMLSCCPKKDLTLEMSVLQVSIALCAGMAPLLIGALLNWSRPSVLTQVTPQSPSFAVLFFVCILGCIGALYLISRMKEPTAKTYRSLLGYVILDWPARVFKVRKKARKGLTG